METSKKWKVFSVLIVAFLIALFLRMFVVEGLLVQGDSMNPTILSGDYVFINKLSFEYKEPALGEVIVAYTRESNSRVIKRVEAMPGQKIPLTDGKKYILDPGEYFLLGDNREASIDSRFFGPVDIWDIKGRVWGVISFKRGKFIKF